MIVMEPLQQMMVLEEEFPLNSTITGFVVSILDILVSGMVCCQDLGVEPKIGGFYPQNGW